MRSKFALALFSLTSATATARTLVAPACVSSEPDQDGVYFQVLEVGAPAVVARWRRDISSSWIWRAMMTRRPH